MTRAIGNIALNTPTAYREEVTHSWLDKDNRAAHTPIATPGQGTTRARSNLERGLAEVIKARIRLPR